MSDKDVFGSEMGKPTVHSPTRKEKLNKITWPILISLAGVFLTVLGMTSNDSGFIVLGLVILFASIYVGFKLYTGQQIVSDRIKLFFDGIAPAIAVIIFILIVIMVISDGFHNVVSLNAAQKKLVASGSQSEQRDFLTFVCKAKAVCKNYPDVKQGCAAAGSIQKCIDIRMNGDDSTMCLDNGEIGGLDEQTTPSAIQCTAFKISEFLR